MSYKNLEVIKERVKMRGKYVYSHLFRCYCGNEFVAEAHSVKSGHTKSCGCYHKKVVADKNTKHGMHDSTSYSSWENMIQRCYNPNATGYKYYGGRGITVCKEWKESYAQFNLDMGKKEGKHLSLDRIDVNGNYEPSNCRWVTWDIQVKNKRKRKCKILV